MKPAAGSEAGAERAERAEWAERSGWMVSDPFTCQGRAHTGGSVQLHRDGGNAAGQETKTETVSQWKQGGRAEQEDKDFPLHRLKHLTTGTLGATLATETCRQPTATIQSHLYK